MAQQDKIIAYFLIFQAAVGAATFGWLATGSDLPVTVWGIYASLIACALVAGVGSLKHRRWAAMLGMAVFAVQTPIIATSSFQFYAWIGIHLDIAMTWEARAKVGVNLIGLGMLAWSAMRYCSPDNSFKPNPLRGLA